MPAAAKPGFAEHLTYECSAADYSSIEG